MNQELESLCLLLSSEARVGDTLGVIGNRRDGTPRRRAVSVVIDVAARGRVIFGVDIVKRRRKGAGGRLAVRVGPGGDGGEVCARGVVSARISKQTSSHCHLNKKKHKFPPRSQLTADPEPYGDVWLAHHNLASATSLLTLHLPRLSGCIQKVLRHKGNRGVTELAPCEDALHVGQGQQQGNSSSHVGVLVFSRLQKKSNVELDSALYSGKLAMPRTISCRLYIHEVKNIKDMLWREKTRWWRAVPAIDANNSDLNRRYTRLLLPWAYSPGNITDILTEMQVLQC